MDRAVQRRRLTNVSSAAPAIIRQTEMIDESSDSRPPALIRPTETANESSVSRCPALIRPTETADDSFFSGSRPLYGQPKRLPKVLSAVLDRYTASRSD